MAVEQGFPGQIAQSCEPPGASRGFFSASGQGNPRRAPGGSGREPASHAPQSGPSQSLRPGHPVARLENPLLLQQHPQIRARLPQVEDLPLLGEADELVTGHWPLVIGGHDLDFEERAQRAGLVECDLNVLAFPQAGGHAATLLDRLDHPKPQGQKHRPHLLRRGRPSQERNLRLGPSTGERIQLGSLIRQGVLVPRGADAEGLIRLAKVSLRVIEVDAIWGRRNTYRKTCKLKHLLPRKRIIKIASDALSSNKFNNETDYLSS